MQNLSNQSSLYGRVRGSYISLLNYKLLLRLFVVKIKKNKYVLYTLITYFITILVHIYILFQFIKQKILFSNLIIKNNLKILNILVQHQYSLGESMQYS